METRDIVKLMTAGAMLLAATVLAALHVCTWDQFLAVVTLLAPSPVGTFASMLKPADKGTP